MLSEKDVRKLIFELIPASYSHFADLDLARIVHFFQEHKNLNLQKLAEPDLKRILVNTQILHQRNRETIPTIAGLILFGKPKVTKYLPQAGAMAARIAGTSITDRTIDLQFFDANAFDNVENVMRMLNLYNSHSFEINGIKREDIFDYPIEALREFVINAFVHRDYTITGSQISILIFHDRIEIKSPGRIPNTLTIEAMKLGVRYYRNPVIMQYFYDAQYVEQMGTGIPKALKLLKQNRNPEPELAEIGEEFRVTVFKRT